MKDKIKEHDRRIAILETTVLKIPKIMNELVWIKGIGYYIVILVTLHLFGVQIKI